MVQSELFFINEVNHVLFDNTKLFNMVATFITEVHRSLVFLDIPTESSGQLRFSQVKNELDQFKPTINRVSGFKIIIRNGSDQVLKQKIIR